MIKRLFSSEIVKGSFILFIMFNLFNFLNFLFQFLMARLLDPADYGIVATLIAFIAIISIPSETIQLVISKYTAKFKLKEENGKIKYLIIQTIKKSLFVSIIILLIVMLVSPIIGPILKIPFQFIILLCLIIFIVFPLAAIRGSIQGMKMFRTLGTNMSIEATIKVVVALILVLAGWKVYGALAGLILGSTIALICIFFNISEIKKSETKKLTIPNIYSNSSQIIFVLILIMVFQSIDIILSRVFFSEVLAGQYAVANLMGKIIFFGTIAISRVMFPISSERSENGGKTNSLLWKSLIIAGILCSGALVIYGLFPEIIVRILFGEKNMIVSPLILNMGIGFGFVALANIVLLYAVSIGKKIRLVEMSSLILIQIIILYLLSQDIYIYSIAMALAGAFIFMGSLLILTKKKSI